MNGSCRFIATSEFLLHEICRCINYLCNGRAPKKEHHICGMISHLGPQLAIADGVALAHKLRKENKVSVAFTGEGGTSEGDFHEALNVAAVWDLPVIFIIENNGYGLSTPVSEQYRCKTLVDRAIGYGMEGITIDGNNI